MRSQEINANNLIEIPIMKSILPDLHGKTVLDLGCGCGDMDMFFINNGAKRVVATDISKNMIDKAKQNYNVDKIDFRILSMEQIDTIQEKFDVVYSSLAFHYVKDFDKLIRDIYDLLNPNGVLVFSQESPLSTAPIFLEESDEKKIFLHEKRYSLLSDYCNETERNNFWNGVKVTKYHRTYVTLYNTLLNNNFKILTALDSYASDKAVALCEKYKYQIDKPYFVFFKVEKVSN